MCASLARAPHINKHYAKAQALAKAAGESVFEVLRAKQRWVDKFSVAVMERNAAMVKQATAR